MLIPVVFSGNAGTRLWSVSREGHLKPFKHMADGITLLENPGIIDLMMIEVQSGEYLGEDDIVLFEGNYGRQ